MEQLAEQATERSRQIPETADELRLSHLFDEKSVRYVHSRILDEEVVFVRDGADVPADMEGIVYRGSELKQLVGCSPKRLHTIHQAKRHFDGELADDLGEDAILPAEDLLADDRGPDACPTCHRVTWWFKASGERVCGICHPDPKPAIQKRPHHDLASSGP